MKNIFLLPASLANDINKKIILNKNTIVVKSDGLITIIFNKIFSNKKINKLFRNKFYKEEELFNILYIISHLRDNNIDNLIYGIEEISKIIETIETYYKELEMVLKILGVNLFLIVDKEMKNNITTSGNIKVVSYDKSEMENLEGIIELINNITGYDNKTYENNNRKNMEKYNPTEKQLFLF